MRRLCTVVMLSAAIVLSAAPARSYTLQYVDSTNRTQIKWNGNRITLALSSSLSNPPTNFKAGSDVVGALRRALASWSEAADIEFVETASKEQSISAAGSKGDGISLVTIADTPENIAPFDGSSSEMSGRTRVFYTRAGSITEADVVLNPYQQFSTDGTFGTYDIEATFVHEIGHLLGLEHSSVVGATMQPRQGKNGVYSLASIAPRTLSQDDIRGACAIYGQRPEFASARGSLTGTITNSVGAQVFGASVWVTEATSGRLAGSSVTLANGTYQIEGLSPGAYTVSVEALDGLILATEIASQRGAYAGLALTPITPFQTEEIGRVVIVADRTIALNGQLSERPTKLNANLIGYNGQLSTLPVPLMPGRIYTIFAGGDGVTLKQIALGGVSVSSKYLTVNQNSVMQQQYGSGVSVISFDVYVNENAPTGEYTVRLQSVSGEISCIVGGLTVNRESAIVRQY